MVRLFLSEPNLQADVLGRDGELGKRWIYLLNQLETVIWSLMTAGGRSEARLWLCNTISGIQSLSPHQRRDLFVNLLRTRPTKPGLASQILQMIVEKRPHEVGHVIAKRSSVLEKFFQDAGHPTRISQWFSNFVDGAGLEHNKGAKALFKFAFVNRDICWEELEWKGKHGQSPAVVATKPHYLLDLDMQQTVENFLENVPEFWSSSEFAESLKDGDIFSIDSKFFLDFFVHLMYEEDARDLWEVVSDFLMEESFSSLCHRLLIILEEREFSTFLEFLNKYLIPRVEPKNSGNLLYWFEFILVKYRSFESIDKLLILNAVINQGRQLLRLVRDEDSQEEQAKVKDIVSQISTISATANSLAPMLHECLKMENAEAIKLLGIQSWVIHYILSEEFQTSESWESLFSNNDISFRRSDKYTLLSDDGLPEENDSELGSTESIGRKRRKKNKSRKKRRKKIYDDDNSCDDEPLDFDASKDGQGLQTKTGSWLLSTDRFSASWTYADLPEHLSKFCFSTWMKWVFHRVEE